MSTGKAEPKVDPRIPQLHTILTDVLVGGCDLNLICMLASHLVTIFSHAAD